jgi:hypothetical protein
MLQSSDFFLLGGKLAGRTVGNLMKGRLRVVKQDFPPSVDLVWLDAVFVAQVQHGNFIDQIPLENSSLLARAEASSWRTHGIFLVCGLILTQTIEQFHFQLVQNIPPS